MDKKNMKPTIVAILAAIGFCLTVELASVYYQVFVQSTNLWIAIVLQEQTNLNFLVFH